MTTTLEAVVIGSDLCGAPSPRRMAGRVTLAAGDPRAPLRVMDDWLILTGYAALTLLHAVGHLKDRLLRPFTI